MNFGHLKSIVAAQKKIFTIKTQSPSFSIAAKRDSPYIEPSFEKVAFEVEKPAVILISAVGATGKTALAQVLSNDLNLPLLDLSKHKPVGDNTLTGVLTTAFPVQDLSGVFDSLAKGTFAIIIDGIDEGRSKTTEKAFEAFLDDIVKLAKDSSAPSFVLLGRTQILDDCWVYLSDKGISAGLAAISPFDLDRARDYIDRFTAGVDSAQEAQYRNARDTILNKLAAAFTTSSVDNGGDGFLSFIGYPPVLDAVATLLQEERNYHRILQELENPESNDVEIGLLYRISSYILRREKEQKVMPNIVQPLVAEMPKNDQERILSCVYEATEQCARLVSHCINQSVSLPVISEPLINEKYEQQLTSWMPEHPFVAGHEFRNAVFEAVALAILINADREQWLQLTLDYLASHKYNYHLVYLLNRIATDGKMPISCLHVLLGSAMEFQSTNATVELHVDSPTQDEILASPTPRLIVETEIEIVMGAEGVKTKIFRFLSEINNSTTVQLGQRLSSAYVSLSCPVILSGAQELELTAPVEISAPAITLQSPTLVLRHQPQSTQEERHVYLEAQSISAPIGSIVTNGVDLSFTVADRAGLTYPSIQYVQEKPKLPPDLFLKEKYLRLKRILVQFRSHSRGSMARFKRKVENERVAGNDVGNSVLRKLLDDSVLSLDGQFYFLHPENVDRHLGISWSDLQKGQISDKLVQYLRSIS